MRARIQAFASVMLALLLAPAMPAASDGSGSYPPPASGDWAITNDTWVSNETIYLGGDLLVLNGTLSIDNVTLVGNLSGGLIHVTVSEVAALSARNCLFRVGNAANLSLEILGRADVSNCIFLKDLGSITIKISSSSSSFKDCIVEGTIVISDGLSPALDGTVVRDAEVGIQFGAMVQLSNLTIQNCTGGAKGGPDATITSCRFIGSPPNIYGLFPGSNSRIIGCGFDSCGAGIVCGDLYPSPYKNNASNVSVLDCDFIRCVYGVNCGNGTLVQSCEFGSLVGIVYGWDIRIDRCTFSYDTKYLDVGQSGIYIDQGSIDVTNCTFQRLSHSISITEMAEARVENCSFDNDSMWSIYLQFDSNLTVRNCTFHSENLSRANIYVEGDMMGPSSEFDLTDCTFQDCRRAILCNGEVRPSRISLCNFIRAEGTAGAKNATITCGGDMVIQDSVFQSWPSTQINVEHGKTRAINVSFDYALVEVKEGASLEVGWYLDALVQYQNGSPAQAAKVEVRDSKGGLISNTTTDSAGRIPRLETIEYVWGDASEAYYTPHWVNASLGGYARSLSVNINQNMDLKMVLQDISQPWITISSPRNGSLQNRSTIRLSGQAGDEAGLDFIHVRVDGIDRGVADGKDNWSIELNLTDGQHVIEAEAVDIGQNTALASVTITIDTTPPFLNITMPGQDALFNTTSIEITGLTEPGSALVVDGDVVPVALGAFRMQKELREGHNQIVITARDAAGNAATSVLRITRDTIPPALTLSSPRDGSLTNSRSITLSGTMEPGAKVLFAGVLVGDNGTFFSYNTTLSEGGNNITVSAVDAAGNWNSVTVRVFLDTAPPSISVELSNGTVIKDKDYTLVGQVEPGSVLSINGVPANVTADGRFSFDLAVHVGNNTIRMVAQDQAGNTATLERLLVREAPDGTKPGGGSGGGGSSWQLQWAIVAVIIAVAAIFLLLVFLNPGRRGPPPEGLEPGGR